MGTPKVKSATHFRANLYDTLKEVSEGQPHIITHNQGEPVVLLSQEEYDNILDEKEVLRKISIGAAEIESGQGISHSNMIKKLRKLQSKWQK